MSADATKRQMFTVERRMLAERRRLLGEVAEQLTTGIPAMPPAVEAAPAQPSFDPTPILEAIRNLESKIERVLDIDHRQIDSIQVDLADISGRIRTTKAEIAQLRHPHAHEDKLTLASEELSAVVTQTEVATNRIMACAEHLDEIVGELRSRSMDVYEGRRLQEMAELLPQIFEACAFQDITGQRIAKVVRALNFIEERVEAMMNAWNVREFETMPLPASLDRTDGNLHLTGPAQQGKAPGTLDQDAIDALFG